METSDHDVLVRLDTKVELLINRFDKFNDSMYSLSERVAALENKDSRDSEKVSAITKDVQQSLHNSERITALEADNRNLRDEIAQLRSRGNTWDIVNSIGIGLGTLVGYIFGGR